MYDELSLMQPMSEQQRMLFLGQMASRRKSETTGVLLAFFLGGFGAHRFYLNQNGLGVLYLLFFWTFIPGLIAFIECFMMPSRVRQANSQTATDLAAQIRMAFPSKPVPPPPAALLTGASR